MYRINFAIRSLVTDLSSSPLKIGPQMGLERRDERWFLGLERPVLARFLSRLKELRRVRDHRDAGFVVDGLLTRVDFPAEQR